VIGLTRREIFLDGDLVHVINFLAFLADQLDNFRACEHRRNVKAISQEVLS
jgi:hypothetical protein